jgi:hypothetical protein
LSHFGDAFNNAVSDLIRADDFNADLARKVGQFILD